MISAFALQITTENQQFAVETRLIRIENHIGINMFFTLTIHHRAAVDVNGLACYSALRKQVSHQIGNFSGMAHAL